VVRRHAARGSDRREGPQGFTLIELLIVVAIIGIIAGVAAVQFRQTPQKAKEAVLRQDLFVLRDVIDQYYADKGRYPESLNTLVDEGYVRKIPVDPITGSDATWIEEMSPASEDDAESPGGIIDVRSGATGEAIDGSYYSDW
jgi:general secretion pathway protein G